MNLINEVFKKISSYRRWLLSFSGGLDSTVLLDILTILRNQKKDEHNFPFILRAIYIHHGKEDNSDRWIFHCRQQCIQRNVPFMSIDISNQLKCVFNNFEATFRNARYCFLYKELLLNEILLTAHHKSDQIETFFLALKRGSGPLGLSSMVYYNLSNSSKISRPLLNICRYQLICYANNHNLIWINDKSNYDSKFDRNFLRLKILPLLNKRWKFFENSVLKSSKLCCEQEKLIDELLSKTLSNLIQSDGSFYFPPLLNMSELKRNALLRRWFNLYGIYMPSYKKIFCVWRNLITSREDSCPKIIFQNYVLCRFRKKLYLLNKSDILSDINNLVIPWPIEKKEIILPQNLGILIKYKINLIRYIKKKFFVFKFCVVRYPKKEENISVRFGKNNNLFLYLLNRTRGRKLKKIWQELNVPTWERNRIPLLFYNDILIAAIGTFVTRDSILKYNIKYKKCFFYWVKEK